MLPQGIEPAVEAALLRGVLDNPTICLLRLGTDGVVLAANEATLFLVGADSLGEMLGKNFTAWIAPEQHSDWQAFLLQVLAGRSASLHCDLIAASGSRRAALLHGVPVDDPVDGAKSIAVAALHSGVGSDASDFAAGRDTLPSDRNRVLARTAEVIAQEADRQRLEGKVRELEDRLRSLTTEYEEVRRGSRSAPGANGSESGRSAEELFDEQQIILAVRETSIWHQLEVSIGEREILLSQLERDLTLTRAELQRVLSESRQIATEWAADRARLEAIAADQMLLHGPEGQVAPRQPAEDDLHLQVIQSELERETARAQLDEIVADRERLEAKVRSLETRQRDLVTQHALELGRLEERLEVLLDQQEVRARPTPGDADSTSIWSAPAYPVED